MEKIEILNLLCKPVEGEEQSSVYKFEGENYSIVSDFMDNVVNISLLNKDGIKITEDINIEYSSLDLIKPKDEVEDKETEFKNSYDKLIHNGFMTISINKKDYNLTRTLASLGFSTKEITVSFDVMLEYLKNGFFARAAVWPEDFIFLTNSHNVKPTTASESSMRTVIKDNGDEPDQIAFTVPSTIMYRSKFGYYAWAPTQLELLVNKWIIFVV